MIACRFSSQQLATLSTRRNLNFTQVIVSRSTKTTTKKTVPPKPPTNAPPQSKSSSTEIKNKKAQSPYQKDPHQVASERVINSPDTRIPGTEAIQSITPQQKMKNFVTAFGLVTFCTGVWYYSMQSVGKADGGIEELRAEAQEAKNSREKKSAEEFTANELAELDATADEIALKEEGLYSFSEDSESRQNTRKPLWKKILFFWKR